MIVLDASAALTGLLNAGPARDLLASEQVHAPHLVDVEVTSALRRGALGGRFTPDAAWAALDTWRRLGITRYGHQGLLERAWALRENLSSYDATYVALAEALGCTLVTADRRLSFAPGLRCPVTVLPSS